MTDVILDVSHIAKTFGHVQALKDITLSLRKGRVHTLLGENGAGKSTLMKILAGVYPPTQGTITLRGETITINNPQHSRQLGIAIIFQELSLSNNMTVAEIFMPIMNRDVLALLTIKKCSQIARISSRNWASHWIRWKWSAICRWHIGNW